MCTHAIGGDDRRYVDVEQFIEYLRRAREKDGKDSSRVIHSSIHPAKGREDAS